MKHIMNNELEEGGVPSSEHILIIKLGALGDFIQAFGPVRAIIANHPGAEFTLLTTKPFQAFAQKSGLFHNIIIDDRPGVFDIGRWIAFRRRLNNACFTRVYDLQNNDRSNLYFHLLEKPKPEWVGTAKKGSHYNGSPDRTAGHAFDGHVQTLGLAGITDIQIDPLHWMDEPLDGLGLMDPYAVLVPGCAPAHPYKRWPAEAYGVLAVRLVKRGLLPVVLGTKDDKAATDIIAEICKDALDLNSRTSLGQIAALGRRAQVAVGNDTGPMHLIAATGTPCVSLFSGKTDPVRHAPKGENVRILRADDIADLDALDVYDEALLAAGL